MTRTGECNGCSACCRFLILNVSPSYLEDDKKRWIELHGIKVFQQKDGTAWVRINATCEHLTDDGTCGIYGQPERPQTCADFPFVQSDIDLIDEWAGQKVCSYEFV